MCILKQREQINKNSLNVRNGYRNHIETQLKNKQYNKLVKVVTKIINKK